MITLHAQIKQQLFFLCLLSTTPYLCSMNLEHNNADTPLHRHSHNSAQHRKLRKQRLYAPRLTSLSEVEEPEVNQEQNDRKQAALAVTQHIQKTEQAKKIKKTAQNAYMRSLVEQEKENNQRALDTLSNVCQNVKSSFNDQHPIINATPEQQLSLRPPKSPLLRPATPTPSDTYHELPSISSRQYTLFQSPNQSSLPHFVPVSEADTDSGSHDNYPQENAEPTPSIPMSLYEQLRGFTFHNAIIASGARLQDIIDQQQQALQEVDRAVQQQEQQIQLQQKLAIKERNTLNKQLDIQRRQLELGARIAPTLGVIRSMLAKERSFPINVNKEE